MGGVGAFSNTMYMAILRTKFRGDPTWVKSQRNTHYGLKQSPRAWFDRFTTIMKTVGYMQT